MNTFPNDPYIISIILESLDKDFIEYTNFQNDFRSLTMLNSTYFMIFKNKLYFNKYWHKFYLDIILRDIHPRSKYYYSHNANGISTQCLEKHRYKNPHYIIGFQSYLTCGLNFTNIYGNKSLHWFTNKCKEEHIKKHLISIEQQYNPQLDYDKKYGELMYNLDCFETCRKRSHYPTVKYINDMFVLTNRNIGNMKSEIENMRRRIEKLLIDINNSEKELQKLQHERDNFTLTLPRPRIPFTNSY